MKKNQAPESEPSAKAGLPASVPAIADAGRDRYRAAFLAALSGFCGNPATATAKQEELAAAVAERAITAKLDLDPHERARG